MMQLINSYFGKFIIKIWACSANLSNLDVSNKFTLFTLFHCNLIKYCNKSKSHPHIKLYSLII